MAIAAPTDPLSRDSLAGRIIGLGRRQSRQQYELCRLLAEYDRSGRWAATGAVACSRWAADALEVDSGTAREWLRVGHTFSALPHIAQAFADGTLSYAKVRTLTRIAVDHPDRQHELIDLAQSCTASALSLELARWSATEEDAEERDNRHQRDMYLSARTEPDGSVVITMRLPPLDGVAAMASIDTHMLRRRNRQSATVSGAQPPADASGPRSGTKHSSLGHRRARAFVHLLTQGGATVTPEFLIHIRDDGATLTNGTPIAEHLAVKLAPASFFRALVHDAERRPINASSRQRHPTTRQKRVVAERDGYKCTNPGCTCTECLEFDHVPGYDESQHTIVDELFLRCGGHHRDRHRHG